MSERECALYLCVCVCAVYHAGMCARTRAGFLYAQLPLNKLGVYSNMANHYAHGGFLLCGSIYTHIKQGMQAVDA